MITILYTCLEQPLPEDRYDYYFRRLPLSLQERNLRFRRWQDRHAHLFGKILLLEALGDLGFAADCLQQLQYNAYARPTISGAVDFNITHAGKYVACAIGSGARIGIDIEQIVPVEFENFHSVMTASQWKEIHESEDPLQTFFTYWTIKESVIKADSRGLSINLNNIHINGNQVICEDMVWNIRKPEIDTGYSVCLASDDPVMEYEMRYYNYY